MYYPLRVCAENVMHMSVIEKGPWFRGWFINLMIALVGYREVRKQDRRGSHDECEGCATAIERDFPTHYVRLLEQESNRSIVDDVVVINAGRLRNWETLSAKIGRSPNWPFFWTSPRENG